MVKLLQKDNTSTSFDNSQDKSLGASNKKLYQCQGCGLKYKEKDWAEKCQAWCKEHKSCNLDIIKQAVQESSE